MWYEAVLGERRVMFDKTLFLLRSGQALTCWFRNLIWITLGERLSDSCSMWSGQLHCMCYVLWP